jgi:hypothetical protein
VKPGEFKSVELSGIHLRYVVININDAGEAVFSLILMDPEAAYEMVVETIDNKVNIYLRLVE